MTQFWYVILMTSLIYSSTILPSGFFYSETDEEDRIVSLHYSFMIVGNSNFQYFQACVLTSRHRYSSTISNLRFSASLTNPSQSYYMCFIKHWCLFECDFSCHFLKQSLQDYEFNYKYTGWFCCLCYYVDDYYWVGNACLLPTYWCVGLSIRLRWQLGYSPNTYERRRIQKGQI